MIGNGKGHNSEGLNQIEIGYSTRTRDQFFEVGKRVGHSETNAGTTNSVEPKQNGEHRGHRPRALDIQEMQIERIVTSVSL